MAAHRVILGLRLLASSVRCCSSPAARSGTSTTCTKAGSELWSCTHSSLGSILFTLGGYLGVFQAINLGRRGTSKLWEWSPEKDGFLGYWFYFVGALVFNVSCIEPLELFGGLGRHWLKREMAWGAAEVGSLCFIAGAFVEVRTTKSLNVFEAVESGRWRKLPFWLSWNNLFGGCLFFTAATAGRWDPTSPGWVYTTYLIGSVNFFIASSIMLWLWKEEQYGLGFIPSINRIVPLRPLEAGKGYRQVSLWHFAFIQVYITLTGASFIDFCFATQRFSVYEQYHGFAHFRGSSGRSWEFSWLLVCCSWAAFFTRRRGYTRSTNYCTGYRCTWR